VPGAGKPVRAASAAPIDPSSRRVGQELGLRRHDRPGVAARAVALALPELEDVGPLRVVSAPHAEAALARMDGHVPDLVLLDVLPGAGGFELCHPPAGRSAPRRGRRAVVRERLRRRRREVDLRSGLSKRSPRLDPAA
jgi:CheY-like chemotaxis protein